MTRGRKRTRKKKATREMLSLEEQRKRSWLETTLENLDGWAVNDDAELEILPPATPPPIPTDSEEDPLLVVEPTREESNSDYTPKIAGFEDFQRELFDALPDSLEDITSEHEAIGGRRVAGYLIGPACAEGTLSTVHKAKELKTGKIVAIKVPKDDIFNEKEEKKPESGITIQSLRKLCEREIGALRALKHPNIVEGIEWFMLDKPYLVMEFVETQMIEVFEKDRSLERISWFMKYAAEGVAHIHSKNMVHLDIRPKQYMVTKDGVLKLVDLGSVRNQGEYWKEGLATAMTPGYIPNPLPEKKGKTYFDWSYDMYALGKTIGTFALAAAGMDDKEISKLVQEGTDIEFMKTLCDRFVPAYNHGTGQYLVNDIIARCLTPRHPDGNYTAEDLKKSVKVFEGMVVEYRADVVQKQEAEYSGKEKAEHLGAPTEKKGATGLWRRIISLGSGSKQKKQAGA